MGLDLVELTMEVEETFGIAIPDADAAGIVTVGELHRYVVEKLRAGEATLTMSGCRSRAAFYRLRRALVEGLGVERRGIRPATVMGSLVAPRGRRDSWVRLEQALGVRLPRLVRPKALVITLTVFIMTAAVVVGLFGASVGAPGLDVLASVFALGITLAVLAAWFTIPFATAIPPACATVRDAVGAVILHAPPSAREGLDPDTVWLMLRSLIVEQLGVHPDEVVEGASFVGDLGAD